MGVVFALLGIGLSLQGVLFWNNATSAFQQITAASVGGTGLVMIFAAAVDAWAWSLRDRIRRIEIILDGLPKAIAAELQAAQEQHDRGEVADPSEIVRTERRGRTDYRQRQDGVWEKFNIYAGWRPDRHEDSRRE